MNTVRKAIFLAALIAIVGSLGFDTAMAQTEDAPDPVLQLVLRVGIGVGMGALISVTKILAEPVKWDNRKFAYGLIIAVFSTFGIVQAFDQPITAANVLSLILEIAGGAFFANQGIKAANRLKDSSTAKTTKG